MENLHNVAATHASLAAQHLREAAQLHEAGEPEEAAGHTLQAHGHLAHATEATTGIAKSLTTPLPQPAAISSPPTSGVKKA
jgi:hypothetical protein